MTPSLSAIRLDNTDWFPADLRTRLEAHEEAFQATEFHEQLKDMSWYQELEVALQDASNGRSVIAYHCTREAEPGEIASRGLRILQGGGDAHRVEFLARHGDKFTAEERADIGREFAEVWGDGYAARGRENRLCFALVHPRHWGSGCRDLLGIYGGESVYSTWGREGAIVDKLRTIGRPAVVHFRLNPKLIKTSPDHPVGQTAMWAWHIRINPEVFHYWCEGRTTVDVSPSDILEVENWSPGDD